YLSGEKEPITAPQYVSSPVEMEGKHFVATTKTVTKDGEIEERRPVFFVGTGHLAEATEDISNYSKYGFNTTHIGFDGWRLMDKIDILPEWEVHTMGERQIHYYTSSDDKKSGNYALGIQSSQPKSDKWNSYNRITQVVKVEPGKTYEYGLSAKATNATGWPLFSVDEVAKSKHSFEGTHDWKDYLFQYTTGKDQTELSFSIYIDSPADEILIDDCIVRLKGTEENLLKNPGFELLPADMDSKSIEGVTDYQIFPNVVENIENNLKKCEESDISAILMLDLHNISDYLFYQDPTVNNGFEKFWNNFIKFNPTHPEMQKFHETMIRSLLPRVKDYSAINHVMLTNEPVFVSYTNNQYYLPIYQEYLREKYGNIRKVNDCWGTEYQDFTEAEMPDRVEGTAQFSDWRKFNDSIMYDYQEFLYKTFKDVAPDVNVTSKFMQPLTKYGNGRVEGGSTNLLNLTQMMDINGCDGWAYYNTDDRDVIIKMAYYDLLTSFKEVPVFNGEDHIIEDSNTADYSEEMMRFNLTDLWQGAIHGRGGSVVWLWDRHYNPSMFINPYLAGRPKLTAEMGKLTLDLNRLSKEIVKIQDEKANVAMLYSLNSMAWNPMYINTLYHAYAAAGNNGQKVHFVDETQMGTLNEYDILIIPGANAVPQNTLLAVNAYVNQGGKVLLLNQDSLKTDEYGQEHDAAIRENIMQKATFVPVVGEEKKLDAESVHAIRNAVEQIVQEASLNTIVVKDLSTGEKLQDAEWLWTRTEDGFLINLCRYDYTDTEVEIYINGQKAENIVDLKKQTNTNSRVTLLGYTPMLLKIKKERIK
ncbi:MAG: beta-galactosidase, partial [Clostridia bacterium]|nr:beta-galactosidase [Clostridia bacterium]